MTKNQDIAIVGMSCYFPGANNIKEFWNNLINGVSSIIDAPEDRIDSRFFSNNKKAEIDRFYCNKGGFVSNLRIDPIKYGVLPIAASGIDPDHLVSLHLTNEALIDAGVYDKNISLQKCSFILGKGNYTGIASYRLGEYILLSAIIENLAKKVCPELSKQELDVIRKDAQSQLGRFQADTAAGAMPNMVVSLTANKFNLRGPAYTIDAACASSLLAVDHSVNLLLSGQCDIALAGGIHLGQGASFWSVFNVIGATSYKGQISPFSEDADGLLIGEGAGIIVLKKLDKAIADNDRIYAVIKACSSSSDGSDVSIMAPSSKGQVETLKIAWDKSGMDPQKIGYVETHGTATQVGDRVEIATLTDFFGDNTSPPALLGSVKSNIGHAMPAAGIAGLIKTALSLYHKKIPPTLNCEKPLKAMFNSRFQPAQQLTGWDENKYPLVAGVNAFGFGGINTHVILEAYSDPVRPVSVSNLLVEEKTAKGRLTGIEETDETKKNKMSVNLDFSMRIVQEFPALEKVLIDYVHKINSSHYSTPALYAEDNTIKDPILQVANNNLMEIATLQKNIMNWYQSNLNESVSNSMDRFSYPISVPDANLQNERKTFEKTIQFDLNEHPYLIDHSIVRQPSGRPVEELNPVVPFAMTIETFCEYAKDLIPGKKIARVDSAGVLKWISVKEPFRAMLSGQWKSNDCISFSIPGHAYGNITLSNAFPDVPEEYLNEFDLGENYSRQIYKKNRIYEIFLFHGPRYQSIVEIVKMAERKLHARIQKTEGKGSLMDNLGQLLGMHCHLYLDKNTTTFPLSVDEIVFYQDFQDQKGIFDYYLDIKNINDSEVVSNVIIKRNGKVWCAVNGWHNRRFDYNREEMNIIMRPKLFILAKQLENNIFYYHHNTDTKASIYDFLFERYLNLKERQHFLSLYLNQARDYLISRVALKDGVRKFIQKDENEELLYPIEISVGYDEKGKPCLYGREELNGIEVSIAHKGSEAVVIVSNTPVGIDIEKIEAKNKEFLQMAFTHNELSLLEEKNNSEEWIARLWVAKEAYGKKLGLGLKGNPKQYEIKSISGENLIIENIIIKTKIHRKNYIIGWTQ